MQKRPVLVSGLLGKMATMVVERLLKSETYEVIPVSLTGEDAVLETVMINGMKHATLLIKPSDREAMFESVKVVYPGLVAVDFSLPDAVNGNAKFFCDHNIPFVMGTTGGDRDLLLETILNSNIPAVVSRNMSIPVVLMMAMIEYAARTFPNTLENFSLFIEESHQSNKKDPSGTAKTIGPNLKILGADYVEEHIRMIRDPLEQRFIKNVPVEFLGGHGYHTYSMLSPDGTVDLKFEHNVRGRDTYINGTIKALDYLVSKIEKNQIGHFDMIDVLRGV